MLGNILGAHPQAFLIDETNGLYPWIEALFTGQDETRIDQLFKQCCLSAVRNYVNPDEKCTDDGTLLNQVTHLILKAPNLTYSADSLAAFLPDSKCIFMCRDIRDIVVSMRKLNWVPIVENQLRRIKADKVLASRFHSAVSALENPQTPEHQAQAHIAKIKTDLRDSFNRPGIHKLEVSYEELVRNTSHTYQAICRHAGLPTDADGSEYIGVMKGWGPGLTYRSGKVNSLSIGQWQDYLSADQQADIWTIAGSTMRALGYNKSPVGILPARNWKRINSELKHSPVIATGRGGSGTRLLSAILQSLGLFTGNRLNHSQDSIEWVNILYKIAIEQHDSNSSTIGDRRCMDLQETAAQVLQEANWDGKQPWGWKLPETMLVLPVVFDSFRDGKLIHIVRHPVDTSLRRTHITSRAGNPVGSSVLEASYKRLGWEQDRITSDPDYLRNAASWLYQVGDAMRYGREKLGPDRYLEVKYEDICVDPIAVQKYLARFLGVDSGSQPLAIEIDPSRRRHWQAPDTRADEVWDICGQIAMQLGYRPIEPRTG